MDTVWSGLVHVVCFGLVLPLAPVWYGVVWPGLGSPALIWFGLISSGPAGSGLVCLFWVRLLCLFCSLWSALAQAPLIGFGPHMRDTIYTASLQCIRCEKFCLWLLRVACLAVLFFLCFGYLAWLCLGRFDLRPLPGLLYLLRIA